jgi:hypothetical protein
MKKKPNVKSDTVPLKGGASSLIPLQHCLFNKPAFSGKVIMEKCWKKQELLPFLGLLLLISSLHGKEN